MALDEPATTAALAKPALIIAINESVIIIVNAKSKGLSKCTATITAIGRTFK